MKTKNPIILSFIAGMCALAFLPQFAGAQPSGTIVTNVSSATNLVWDCSAGLTNVAVDVAFKNSVAVAVSYPVSVSQSGSGAISGGALDPAAILKVEGYSFPFFGGRYKVTGSATSNKGKGHVIINSVASGTIHGVEARRVNVNHTLNIRFDNSTLTVTGKVTDVVSVHPPINVGDATGRGSYSTGASIGTVVPGDGSWILTLIDLATTGKTVLGSATVVLDSGASFHFKVHGSFAPSTGLSKLTLTANDKPTRGSSLRVVLNANAITSIRGVISGQAVNVSF